VPDLDVVIQQSNDPIELLKKLQSLIGADSLPEYLIRYIQTTMQSPETIAFHQSSTVENMKDADKEKIERTKGLLGQVKRDFPTAVHHFKIFYGRPCRTAASPEPCADGSDAALRTAAFR
jgi:hypothetical protein